MAKKSGDSRRRELAAAKRRNMAEREAARKKARGRALFKRLAIAVAIVLVFVLATDLTLQVLHRVGVGRFEAADMVVADGTQAQWDLQEILTGKTRRNVLFSWGKPYSTSAGTTKTDMYLVPAQEPDYADGYIVVHYDIHDRFSWVETYQPAPASAVDDVHDHEHEAEDLPLRVDTVESDVTWTDATGEFTVASNG